jgi:cysteine/O-acetylserine efflux protein
MGIKYGFNKSINFIYGSFVGFLIVLSIAGLFSNFLLIFIPSFASIMRWIGSAYILYLAYNMLKADYSFTKDGKDLEIQPLGFKHGALLQLFNPKSIMFILTLYTTFLYPISTKPLCIFLSTLILGLFGFSSNLLWTFLGARISNLLNQEHFKRTVNLILALLLVYSAIKLTGIISL